MAGSSIILLQRGRNLFIIDQSGKAAKSTISDVNRSNGVIHVVDKVLLPK